MAAIFRLSARDMKTKKKIAGIGIDIIQVKRMREAIERRGEAFLRKVFTPKEIQYCECGRYKYHRYSGIFAGKEGCFKALGLGLIRDMRWKDIEILKSSDSSQFTIKLKGATKILFDTLELKSCSISISCCKVFAIASVICFI